MTKLKFLLLFLFFTTGYAHAQWEIQLDVENFTFLDRICFIDSLNGWAIGGAPLGAASPYFYTTDGGENWYLDDDWMTISGTDIVFVNHDTGFITTQHGKIYKTTDNGQTWDTIQTPATQDVIRLFFVDENNGWATLAYPSNKILHTTDNGDNWELQEYEETANCYTDDVFFINTSVGWVGLNTNANDDYSKINKTQDGGVNWTTQYSQLSQYFEMSEIFFTKNQIGWAVGKLPYYTPHIIKTSDGGDNWIEQTIEYNPYETKVISCVYFINDTIGWIGTGGPDFGSIYFTSNGGENWQLQQEFSNPIFDIYALNKDTAWAVGEDFIYRNNNADTVIITSINEVNKEKAYFTLQPNPVKYKIQIRIFNNFDNANIQISNVTGVIVKQFPVSQKKSVIDLSYLQKGFYFLTLTLNNQIIQTKKIIKL